MKDSQRKAMFVKGKKSYLSWQESKKFARKLGAEKIVKVPHDYDRLVKTGEIKVPKGIPKTVKALSIVYSRDNVVANRNAGVDIKKEIFY